ADQGPRRRPQFSRRRGGQGNRSRNRDDRQDLPGGSAGAARKKSPSRRAEFFFSRNRRNFDRFAHGHQTHRELNGFSGESFSEQGLTRNRQLTEFVIVERGALCRQLFTFCSVCWL